MTAKLMWMRAGALSLWALAVAVGVVALVCGHWELGDIALGLGLVALAVDMRRLTIHAVQRTIRAMGLLYDDDRR